MHKTEPLINDNQFPFGEGLGPPVGWQVCVFHKKSAFRKKDTLSIHINKKLFIYLSDIFFQCHCHGWILF
jgi:hypothetical protein